MAEYKLDIFRVLKQADLKNTEFYAKLTEEEQKAFQPFLTARWLSGTFSARQVFFLNEIANQLVFSLANHKHLLWLLLTICTSGKPQRYVWNKLPAKTTTARPASAKVLVQKYGYSMRDANEALLCLSGNDILDLAEALGWQTEDLSKIRKEYKDEKLRGDTVSPSRKSKTKRAQANDDLLEF